MNYSTKRRVFLIEAIVALIAARLAMHIASPAQLFAAARRSPKRVSRFRDDEIQWVSWAVGLVGAKRWMKATSLTRALAAQAMLRRRGIASQLCMGVTCDGSSLISHAWLETSHGIAGSEPPRCSRLATS